MITKILGGESIYLYLLYDRFMTAECDSEKIKILSYEYDNQTHSSILTCGSLFEKSLVYSAGIFVNSENVNITSELLKSLSIGETAWDERFRLILEWLLKNAKKEDWFFINHDGRIRD
jgi:hypothetical protein